MISLPLLLLLLPALAPQSSSPPSRIAFGSCFQSDGPAEIWSAVAAFEPDLLLMLGDNVYADTRDMDVMRVRYEELDAVPAFAALRRRASFLATWDDHDYGENDAGADYPAREAAQQVFLDWLGVPEESPRRKRPGVYHEAAFGPEGRRLQVVLLDTRYFRSPLERRKVRRDPALGYPGNYRPSHDEERTVLGEAQWEWLAEVLARPADVRVIASSIQVAAEDHGFETWANLPLERRRLLETIRASEAEGVLFVSGDRHLAELSVLDPERAAKDSAVDVGYPLIDLTSSSLNRPSTWRNEINRHRLGTPYFEVNFGTIEIDWETARLALAIRGAGGQIVLRHDLTLDDLRHADRR